MPINGRTNYRIATESGVTPADETTVSTRSKKPRR